MVGLLVGEPGEGEEELAEVGVVVGEAVALATVKSLASEKKMQQLADITSRSYVKCWDSNSIGDRGGRQGRMGVNSDGFLRCWMRGVSTPDLVVTEFQMGCEQTDLASACVLRPLNCLVLNFKMGGMTG